MIRAIIFDLDGTLIDSGQAGQAAMEASLASLFGVTRPTEGISTAGRTDRAIIEDLMVFHGLCVDEATFGRVCEAYLQVLPAELARLEGITLPGVGDHRRRRDRAVYGFSATSGRIGRAGL